MTSSNPKPDTLSTGSIITGDASLAELLAPQTVADANAALSLLETRYAAAEASVAVHAEGRDNALLAGTETAHDADARRLADDARRLWVAIERTIRRREELAAVERQAAGKRHAEAAAGHAAQAEALVVEYAMVALKVGEVLNALEAECGALIRERNAAQKAGVPCEVKLPHESRFRAPRFEAREIITRQRAPGVFNVSGKRLGDNREPDETVSCRIEQVQVDPGHRSVDLAKARAMLPAIDGGLILDRNRD